MSKILKIAAELAYGNTWEKILSENEEKYLLELLLVERCRRLNRGFEWTKENQDKFLHVNNNLFELCKKGWQKALDEAKLLEERIEKCDFFLKDYEIRVKINTYPKILGIKGLSRDVVEAVESYLAEEMLTDAESISHCHYKNVTLNDKEFPKYLIDMDTNWNFVYFGNIFKDDYICYLTHCILDTGVWSYQDILSIERIWVDVEVTHQHYTDIPKIKNLKKEK